MSDAKPTPEVTPEATPEPTPAVTPSEPEWLPARLDRAKRSERAAVLESLGVDDLDAAKAAIEEAKRIKAEQMTEAERKQTELDAALSEVERLKTEAAAREASALRSKVAAEVGLPEVLAAKLEGADEDAMRAEAKAILAALPQASQGLPPAAGDVEPPNPADGDPFLKGLATAR